MPGGEKRIPGTTGVIKTAPNNTQNWAWFAINGYCMKAYKRFKSTHESEGSF
ncbi:MAG: hypothetical protein UX91_C0005G0090 [Candidatus Amesbacteria bacterium GW2011_GWB1_47_19]|nr:MAG: hypothetical protein UW51_C0007G0090 [Candidatus Amesbacteria bacterium GW2011_GWA1_44_24]KKU31172.1 MAG: hypothetical protein UX46_C0007G0090 [Candidatus Amesbacteria bacterium GW2011_GWC1_46_24]KKU67293.1 MAG: hypothetical protein UX91_C0005G0090 [Candidatus Amesbacteria bacterium GW2011_GWB1_47_19]